MERTLPQGTCGAMVSATAGGSGSRHTSLGFKHRRIALFE